MKLNMHSSTHHYAVLVCMKLTIFAIMVAIVCGQTTEPDEPWTGRWFPHSPFSDIVTKSPLNLHDDKHGIKMGIPNPDCDDAKTNLTLDWDFSPEAYTCYSPNNKFIPKWKIKPILECEHIPKYYIAHHVCMNTTIQYQSAIPTFGMHRPLWARYGEYKFVPRQRWLHNLEHGGIVMLYHPCANPLEVNRLRHLVTNCLYRHVITPNPDLDQERPLALLSWGCRLTMSTVQPGIIQNFIKQHALVAPEKVSEDGQYDLGLREQAKLISDKEDSVLCPRRR